MVTFEDRQQSLKGGVTLQTKAELYQALCASAAEAVSFARRYVTDALPEAVRFDADLRADVDSEGRLRFDPRFQPYWSQATNGQMPGLSAAALVEVLWHEGHIPEWMDLSVVDEDGSFTYIEVRFSRFLLPAEAWGGRSPFGVRGPYIPLKFARQDDPPKFSLHEGAPQQSFGRRSRRESLA